MQVAKAPQLESFKSRGRRIREFLRFHTIQKFRTHDKMIDPELAAGQTAVFFRKTPHLLQVAIVAMIRFAISLQTLTSLVTVPPSQAFSSAARNTEPSAKTNTVIPIHGDGLTFPFVKFQTIVRRFFYKHVTQAVHASGEAVLSTEKIEKKKSKKKNNASAESNTQHLFFQQQKS